MRDLHPVIENANSIAKERYENARTLIQKIHTDLEKKEVLAPLEDYFNKVGGFILEMMAHAEVILDEAYFLDHDFETLKELNHGLYSDIVGENYEVSYVNPAYACEKFGKEMGQLLSGFNFQIRQFVGLAYEQRRYEMMLLSELYLDLHQSMIVLEEKDTLVLRRLMREKLLEDIDLKLEIQWLRKMTPEFDTYSHIVDHYDLMDLRYMFRYGMYIGENEILSAKHIGTFSEEKIELIANTYSEAFMRSYERTKKPFAHKKSLLYTYHIGFERIIRKAYENFGALGLKPIVFYELEGAQRPRLYNTKPNEQMEYDHRFSDGLYVDAMYFEVVQEAYKKVMEKYKEAANVYAGLALIEIFGGLAFSPKNKSENMVYDSTLGNLVSQHMVAIKNLSGQYVPGSTYSFTINDYPLPSIGPDYEGIFDGTIAVNTLDQELYEVIQQQMIDTLDLADYVVIKGEGDNLTDLKVQLKKVEDGSSQTKFMNCTADVNVPVGEIYTSPVLKGTNGLLHVKEVYLTGLFYKELKIWFEDGMITKYDCANYDNDAENHQYVKETLLHPHESLPLGEFAIGTNTVAYMMARHYNIQAQLPILIGEKTGPHFAIGDTCFVWSEDTPAHNPDGKEMIARENEKTRQRKTNLENAYTYCHTDITIPYDELDSIIGYSNEGLELAVIQKGRFVLPGTEALNNPFDDPSYK